MNNFNDIGRDTVGRITITPEDRRAYDKDGAVILKGIINGFWRERVAEAIERDIKNPGPFCHSYDAADGKGRFHGNLRTWENDPDFRAYCFDSPLPDIAAQFFGSPKVNLLYDQLFVKEPGTANPTRWHNDQPYWPVRGWEVMSFWLALDPTTADTGRLEFVKGSHKWDRWFQPEAFGKGSGNVYAHNSNYEKMPDIDANREAYDIIGWDMQPGDVIAFHAMAVHSAGGNLREDVRRRGYTVRYTGDQAWYDTRPGTSEALMTDELKDGDSMDSSTYPVVWRANNTASA
ncbi:MAG: phytanoyl-CoA dioxygenase family protein [Rhodospirillaceae bacterium]|nr:phytanoyl-CoA dioxygenase family protein [Rhodospirillaceae bacterium]